MIKTADRLFKLLSHMIECAGELSNFIARLKRQSGIELPFAHRIRSPDQLLHRLGNFGDQK
ncbi:hypothetical protein D3C81_2009860 [compost metagenome]